MSGAGQGPAARPRRGGRHPSVPFAPPYGAHVAPGGVQFTLFSRHARRVWLMLFDDPEATHPAREIELLPERHRIGDIWHTFVPRAHAGQFYLYRLAGDPDTPEGRFYDPDQWVLDPYALAVAGSPRWGDTRGLRPGTRLRPGRHFPKGVILREDFDWGDDRPPCTPLAETVVYEAHVRSFTAHPSSRVRHPGTFLGLVERIPHLLDLGVTAVELLPVQEFNEMEFYLENTGRENLRNLWGYSTLAFFAPNGRYAAGGVVGRQVREFKQMVKALHAAGLEVWLDVVFNHTGEGGDGGPTYSFRGLDNSIYYLMGEDGAHYLNFTGCGNTVNGNHPVVRDFILDCLRYWVLHLRVDGFRFDLASVLTRGRDGKILPDPPVVAHIAEDPALRHTKIIAEAWDAAGAYQVGSFPSDRWSEWNGRFRDDVRRFWRGDAGQLSAFATRLCGSPDLYDRLGQTPVKSINFVTAHDGFTLHDLVTYETRHNEANGENNRDGDPNNLSCNHGVEGPTGDPAILAVRRRQMRNFIATLLVARGVPMLLSGDEFARTQGGNNNAYGQDNEHSWLNWSPGLEEVRLREFVRELIAFRRTHPVLARPAFLRGRPGAEGAPPDVEWFGPDGGPVDWERGRALACRISGHPANAGTADDDLFFAFNAGDAPAAFTMPRPGGQPWRPAFHTADGAFPYDEGARRVRLEPRAMAALTSSA